MLKLQTIPVGMLQVNCYLVWDDSTREGLLVDPGAEAPRLLAAVMEHGISLKGILLTHGHVDHIGALPELAAHLGAPVWMAAEEVPLYKSPLNELMPWLPHMENLPEPAKTMPSLASAALQAIPTPGHTPGGVSYYFPDDKFILTGDTLFAGAVGRTDLGGDADVLKHSVTEVLFALPEETAVYPGHGPSTTIGREKAAPFQGW